MDVLLQLLGLATLLAAIAPVAMAGGRMIAAFMLGQQILPWLGIALLTMLLLVGGSLLALRVVMPVLAGVGGDLLAPLVSAAALLAPPWGAWLLGRRWVAQTDHAER
jgi:hypothetical protein